MVVEKIGLPILQPHRPYVPDDFGSAANHRQAASGSYVPDDLGSAANHRQAASGSYVPDDEIVG